jgi:hypothetical protein
MLQSPKSVLVLQKLVFQPQTAVSMNWIEGENLQEVLIMKDSFYCNLLGEGMTIPNRGLLLGIPLLRMM